MHSNLLCRRVSNALTPPMLCNTSVPFLIQTKALESQHVLTKSNSTYRFLPSIAKSLLCLIPLQYTNTNAYVVQHQHLHSVQSKNNNKNTQVDAIPSLESVRTLISVLATTLPVLQ